MNSIQELYRPFQELIHLATGLPLKRIIVADQAKGSPKNDPFCTFKVVVTGTQGAPRTIQTLVAAEDTNLFGHQDADVTTVQRVKIRVSVNIFRQGAMDAAWKLEKCNYRQPIEAHLLEHQIQWSKTSPVLDLTDLEQTQYRQRAHIDLNLIVEGKTMDRVLIADSIETNVDLALPKTLTQAVDHYVDAANEFWEYMDWRVGHG